MNLSAVRLRRDNLTIWAVNLVALALLGVVCADLWSRYTRLSGPDEAARPAAPQGATPPRPAYRVETIVAAHLFGAAEAPPAQRMVAAPTTRLNLELYGVVASDSAEHSRALIGHNAAAMQSYRLGQRIDGTDATLFGVEPGRVLLDRGGRIESLSLPKPDLSVDRGGDVPQPVPRARRRAQTEPDLSGVTRALRQQAGVAASESPPAVAQPQAEDAAPTPEAPQPAE